MSRVMTLAAAYSKSPMVFWPWCLCCSVVRRSLWNDTVKCVAVCCRSYQVMDDSGSGTSDLGALGPPSGGVIKAN